MSGHKVADVVAEVHRMCRERTLPADMVVPTLCTLFPGITRDELLRANEIAAADNGAELEYLLTLLDATTAAQEERRSEEVLARFRRQTL